MQLLSKFFASKVHKTSEREQAGSNSQCGPRPGSGQHQRPAERREEGGERGEERLPPRCGGGEGGHSFSIPGILNS